MTTGFNICPICNKKYLPKNESRLKVNIANNHKESICLNCYYKLEQEINTAKNKGSDKFIFFNKTKFQEINI
jgi:transcription elongation factor Elf1